MNVNEAERQVNRYFWRALLVFWFVVFAATVAALIAAMLWRAAL